MQTTKKWTIKPEFHGREFSVRKCILNGKNYVDFEMAFGIIVIVNVNYVIQCANVSWIENS